MTYGQSRLPSRPVPVVQASPRTPACGGSCQGRASAPTTTITIFTICTIITVITITTRLSLLLLLLLLLLL